MTHKDTILACLRDAGTRGVTNVEFNRFPIFRYSARIHELRKQGHTIRTIPEGGSVVRFVLEAEAPVASPGGQSPPALSDLAPGDAAGQLFDTPRAARSPYNEEAA